MPRYRALMARPFRFAVQVRTLDDPSAIIAAARTAELLGYDELYSYDHIGAVDPFVPLMVAAAATSRLRVGPLVINNELHHPVLLARAAATADRLTGGRLVLGMGTGYAQDEHDAIGLPLRPPGPRVARFAESLEVVRSLLDTGAAAFDGAHHHVGVESLGVRPVQSHVPILVGGHGRRVMSVAARHADIVQFTGLTKDEAGALGAGGFAVDAVVERVRWLEEAAGDRNDHIERSTLVQMTHVGGDVEAALVEAERFGLDRPALEACPFVFIGSLERVVDQLETLREATGISHVVVRDAEGFAPVVAALAGR